MGNESHKLSLCLNLSDCLNYSLYDNERALTLSCKLDQDRLRMFQSALRIQFYWCWNGTICMLVMNLSLNRIFFLLKPDVPEWSKLFVQINLILWRKKTCGWSQRDILENHSIKSFFFFRKPKSRDEIQIKFRKSESKLLKLLYHHSI